jgi:hypothetical protein
MFDSKTKIEIRSIFGSVLFEFAAKDNTIAKTVAEAIRKGANLSYADLRSADLSYADLRSADLSYANLSYADLRYADLRSAKNLPLWWTNQCSRDMLFIFQALKAELPYLRERLVSGQIDGTQYEGECACLIGSLGKADGGVENVCKTIPYYDKGLHNLGEQWFFQIRPGDTPEKSEFAKHALKLIDSVINASENKTNKLGPKVVRSRSKQRR